MKITIITSYSCDDGPVYDAALVLPEGMDVRKQNKIHQDWYYNVYCKNLAACYHSFIDHLLSKGARHATDEEVEVFED